MGEILIVDTITAQPGQARALYDRYMADYAPGARARGMELRRALIEPPLAMRGDRVNTLSFVWAVDGVEGWWRARFASSFDRSIGAFWQAIAPLVRHRTRTNHGEAIDHV